MNGASIAFGVAANAPASDASDDEVMQNLGLAVNLFKSRFGEEALIACLQDLLKTLQED